MARGRGLIGRMAGAAFGELRSWLGNERLWASGSWVGPVASKVTVSAESSLGVTTVLACVTRYSQTMASLPIHVFRRTDPGGSNKERDHRHSLSTVLRWQTNATMDAAYFTHAMEACWQLRGVAYAAIERNRRGEVIGLWPLHPDRVTRGRKGGLRRYEYRPLGEAKPVMLEQDEVFELAPLFEDEYGQPISRISHARETIGTALAMEKHAGAFFGNGALPGGVLATEKPMKDDDARAMAARWESAHRGVEKAYKVAVLSHGFTYTPVGIKPEEAQFIETMQFSAGQVCRIYLMPPHIIGIHNEGATFGSVEQQSLDFKTNAILPRVRWWEMSINTQLVDASELGEVFAEFDMDQLVRGDYESRMKGYAIGIINGWMNRNEVRAKENMNPVEGLDEFVVAVNMQTAAQLAAGEPDGEEGTDGGEKDLTAKNAEIAKKTQTGNEKKKGKRSGESPHPALSQRERVSRPERVCDSEEREERVGWQLRTLEERGASAEGRLGLRDVYRSWLREALQRVVKREVREIRKAAKKHLGTREAVDLVAWVEEFYGGEFGSAVAEMLGEAVAAYVERAAAMAAGEVEGTAPDLEKWIEAYCETVGYHWEQESKARLSEILKETEEDLEGAIERQLDRWVESRADSAANREAVQIGEATAKTVWRENGVIKLVWQTQGETCPLCLELNGKVVGIDEPFARKGELINPNKDGQDRDVKVSLRLTYDVGHAPLHGGCDCRVLPAA